jgi:hypothetical protein
MAEFSLHDLPAITSNLARNDSARIIRNGLVVQCFNTFEDFVRERCAEILNHIETSSVSFGDLPSGLQNAVTIESLKAIGFQIKIQDPSNRINFVQNHCEKISSTKRVTFSLSEIAFFHSAANVTKEDIKSTMSSFMIENPWEQIRDLCSRIGLSAMAAETVFQDFAQRRHRAAHRANTSISEVDLSQSLLDASGLAIGFDVLLSMASNLVVKMKSPLLPKQYVLPLATAIPLRFIKYNGNKYIEIKEAGRRSVSSDTTALSLIPGAVQRTKKENGVLVIFDSGGKMAEWKL